MKYGEHEGLEGAPPSKQKMNIVNESELGLVQKLLPACRDALLQVSRQEQSTALCLEGKKYTPRCFQL